MQQAFFDILEFINHIVGNYGVSIVIFTILLRTVLLPLDIKQRHSMQKQAAIQPQVEDIKKRYKNDPKLLQQKTGELYKKNGVNMLGGCLPMLLQYPILIILFGALGAFSAQKMMDLYLAALPVIQSLPADFVHSSVLSGTAFSSTYRFLPELTTLPGMPEYFSTAHFLWVQNVFRPDSLFSPSSYVIPAVDAAFINQKINDVLVFKDLSPSFAAVVQPFAYQFPKTNGLFLMPIIVAGSQFLQTKLMYKLNPQTAGTGQMKGMNKFMMYGFPLLALWFCASYTTMFTLYWLTSSVMATLVQIGFNYVQKRKKALQA